MKRVLPVLILMIISAEANALRITDIGNGMRHMWAPQNVGLQDRFFNVNQDISKDYKQEDWVSLNLGLSQIIELGKSAAIRLGGTFNTGHRSKSYTVAPYLVPSVDLFFSLTDNLHMSVSATSKIIGGETRSYKYVAKLHESCNCDYGAVFQPLTGKTDYGKVPEGMSKYDTLDTPDTTSFGVRFIYEF